MSKESLDRITVLAAGALAGGVATTPEDAAKFASDCYDKIKEANRERVRNSKGPARIV